MLGHSDHQDRGEAGYQVAERNRSAQTEIAREGCFSAESAPRRTLNRFNLANQEGKPLRQP